MYKSEPCFLAILNTAIKYWIVFWQFSFGRTSEINHCDFQILFESFSMAQIKSTLCQNLDRSWSIGHKLWKYIIQDFHTMIIQFDWLCTGSLLESSGGDKIPCHWHCPYKVLKAICLTQINQKVLTTFPAPADMVISNERSLFPPHSLSPHSHLHLDFTATFFCLIVLDKRAAAGKKANIEIPNTRHGVPLLLKTIFDYYLCSWNQDKVSLEIFSIFLYCFHGVSLIQGSAAAVDNYQIISVITAVQYRWKPRRLSL